jgi:prepilin-type N-terminal cleavage/methylation domain-containing protein
MALAVIPYKLTSWGGKLKPLMKSAGFSLIEILIALVILSISLLGLAGLMATASQNTSFGGHIMEAATFAQDRLEEVRVIPWGSVATGNDTKTGSTGIVYTRALAVSSPTASLKTVTITVTWNDSTNHSFDFISAVSE